MKEEFNRIGDYILRHDITHFAGSNDGVRKHDGMTRYFNFAARQVMTVHRDWLSEGRGSNSAGTSALATHAETQGFDDLPSDMELRIMHAKLVELGGRPPALEDVLPNALVKKGATLRPPGA